MRKSVPLILLAAVLLPSCATSRRAELREDRREVREQRRDLRDARRDGDRRDIRKQREDVRDAQRELRKDRRD